MNRYGIKSKFGNFLSKVARIPSQCCVFSRERHSVEKTLFESSLAGAAPCHGYLGTRLQYYSGAAELKGPGVPRPTHFSKNHLI